MVISQDKDKGRFSLSTKSLEPEPGDMLKDQAGVFSQAEAMAARYHERLQAENKAREEVPPPPASARCRGETPGRHGRAMVGGWWWSREIFVMGR